MCVCVRVKNGILEFTDGVEGRKGRGGRTLKDSEPGGQREQLDAPVIRVTHLNVCNVTHSHV